MSLIVLGDIRWWVQALAVIFIIICLALIVLVLLQKGRGGGLAAAFGGSGGQSAFGSKTGDVFTWITIVVVSVFLLLSLVLTRFYKPFVSTDEEIPTMLAQPRADAPADMATATDTVDTAGTEGQPGRQETTAKLTSEPDEAPPAEPEPGK